MDLKKTQDAKNILSIDDVSKSQLDINPIYECIDPNTCAITDPILDESFPITIGESFTLEQDDFKQSEYSSQNWIISNPNIHSCNETPGFRPTAPLDLMIGGLLPSTQSYSSLESVYRQDNNPKVNILDINAYENIPPAYTLPDDSETNSRIFQCSSTVNTINNAENITRNSNDSLIVSKSSHYEEQHRREYHIANERKRRRRLQEAFTYLSSLLYCRDYPMTRMIILDTAIETIKILKAELSQRNTQSG